MLHGQLGSDALAQLTAPREVFHTLECEIGIDRAGSVSAEQGEVHHFAGLAGLGDQSYLSACLLAHQQIVYCRQSEQAWNRSVILVDTAIRKDQ